MGPCQSLAVSSAANQLYVLDGVDANVQIFSVLNNQPVATVSLTAGGTPNFLTFDTHLLRVYVTDPKSNNVSFVDVTALSSKATVVTDPGALLNQPSAVTVLPDGSRAYVLNQGATLGVMHKPTPDWDRCWSSIQPTLRSPLPGGALRWGLLP